jgi:hypothetical protein
MGSIPPPCFYMYITHNEELIPTEYLGTTGIIQSNYKLLHEMFGEPNILNSGHLHVEWRIRIGPHIAAITNYIGVTQPKLENVALWPISCTSPEAVNALREILENPIPSMRRKIETEIALAGFDETGKRLELLESCARNLEQLCKATTIMCRNTEMALANLKGLL